MPRRAVSQVNADAASGWRRGIGAGAPTDSVRGEAKLTIMTTIAAVPQTTETGRTFGLTLKQLDGYAFRIEFDEAEDLAPLDISVSVAMQ
jgi:hypothetical protein